MLEREIDEREAELRRLYPRAFDHPGLKENEMCAGQFIPDDGPELVVRALQAKGLHARLGAEEFERGVCHRPIFVSIREQIIIEAETLKRQSVS
jgi:hypothetical protein